MQKQAIVAALAIAIVVIVWRGWLARPEPAGPSIGGGATIVGNVLLGPTCPVMREPPDPQCADKPYATRLALTTADGAQVLREFSSGADGTFSIQVAPGTYTIRSAAAADILPYCATNNTVVVTAGVPARVTVYCDTGIR